MSSVRTIARRAGVSSATVSRVLNNHPHVSDAVRRRVLDATTQARYLHRVGRRSTSNIALLYTDALSLGSPFDAAILDGLAQALEPHGLDLLILDARSARLPGETYAQMFMRKGVRGAIVRTTSQSRGICEAIAEESFPAVVVGERFDNPKVSYVYSDSRQTSREAVEHLIGLGHRRIAICINVIEDSDHADRFDAYQQVLRQHNTPIEEKYVLRVPANREGGEQALRRLIAMPDRPTAVFLTDPMGAVGAMSELRARGIRVPDDISIVGFDDAQIRFALSPRLTSICQDATSLGKQAAAALCTILDSDSATPPIRQKVRTWFELHDSTGKPSSKE